MREQGPCRRTARAARFLVGGVLVGLLLLPSAAAIQFPPSYSYKRFEEPDENYLVGHLTWRTGNGGVSWSGATETDDPGGPQMDTAAETHGSVEQAAHAYAGAHVEGVPDRVDEFVSEPVPRSIHLNVSRYVQVDLFISNRNDNSNRGYADPCQYYSATTGKPNTGAGDPLLRVEVYVGDVLLGGTDWDQNDAYRGTRLSDPPGYSACRYRFGPELDEIPPGATVRVRVIVLEATRTFQYGLAGEHRSFVAIAGYSEEEWLFRQPVQQAFVSDVEEGRDAASDGSLSSFVGLAFGLFGLAAARRRGVRAGLVLLLLAGVGFAGCLGGSSPRVDDAAPPKSTVDVQHVPAGNQTLSRPGLGTIAGTVHDPDGAPLRGAHVSLLGTNNFTDTDGGGRFVLPGIPPGRYRLRIDQAEFLSVEADIDVRTDAVARLDVTLVPVEMKDANLRFHRHDYWDGQSHKVIFEGPMGVVCSGGSNCMPRLTIPFGADPTGGVRSILPGTKNVEVVFTWSAQDMGIERVAIELQANHDTWPSNATMYLPRESGKAFNLRANWEMADAGHQLASTWIATIVPPLDHPYGLAQAFADIATGPARLTTPQFSAKVTIHRGVVPLERPHPDPWGTNLQLPVIQQRTAYPVTYILPPGAPLGDVNAVYFTPDRIVPPGTEWIQANFTPEGGTGLPNNWRLYFRSGAHPFLPQYDGRPGEDFRLVTEAPALDQGRLVWRFKIAADESDPIYARRSSVAFGLVPTDETAEWANDWAQNGQATMSAAAHRDPMP
ncbi:MAG: carboxypeptidase regulatory-like domain-containing protein [Euryarchaeota archaeon]|nr:carboxypeptidase regulatory-like domain-containing protein [Euryarchaeota archaeon]